jgi:hypothetical protein
MMAATATAVVVVVARSVVEVGGEVGGVVSGKVSGVVGGGWWLCSLLDIYIP